MHYFIYDQKNLILFHGKRIIIGYLMINIGLINFLFCFILNYFNCCLNTLTEELFMDKIFIRRPMVKDFGIKKTIGWCRKKCLESVKM